MNIYFFSDDSPDPKMLQDLGASITTQFRGEIDNIHATGRQISFTETLFIGGQTIKASHTIPKAAIVVVEAPPLLQGDWLKAGIAVLLVLKMKQETDERGDLDPKYCGLLQVHKIEVVTSEWTKPATIAAPYS